MTPPPIDERIRQKAIVEKARMPEQRHMGAEPSFPPASEQPQPSEPHALAKVNKRMGPVAEFLSHSRNIVIALAFFLTPIGALLAWYIGRRIDERVDAKFEQLVARFDPLVIRPSKEEMDRRKSTGEALPPTLSELFTKQAERSAKLEEKLDAPTSPQSELGRKLDALDKTLQERLPKRADKVSLPKVGPTAKAEGMQ